MPENTKPISSTAPNPAKSANPPSLPTKSTRGDAKTTPTCSTRGNGK